MKYKILLLTLFGTLLGVGHLSAEDASAYQRCGRAKPIVMVAPMIDRTEITTPEVSWDVADELTAQIRSRIFNSHQLYLFKENGESPKLNKLAEKLSSPDLRSVAKMQLNNMAGTEFILVTELLRQEEVLQKHNSQGEKSGILAMDVRLRVIDVRSQHPKVILQEMFHYDHPIGSAYRHSDYEMAAWGTEAFKNTPLGLVHQRLARAIVSRTESYIHSTRR